MQTPLTEAGQRLPGGGEKREGGVRKGHKET